MTLSEKQIIELLNQKKDRTAEMKSLFKGFEKEVIPELKKILSETINKNQNVYQMTGCKAASTANAVTRTFSTKLGTLWEKIAMLSPNVLSPEFELGFKIPEIDIIVKYNDELYYTQLKTQKNTLTGSQSSRTVMEFSKYKHTWFVACIDNDSKWTAPSSITRLKGKEFWDKIGINYSEILFHLKELCQSVENLLK